MVRLITITGVRKYVICGKCIENTTRQETPNLVHQMVLLGVVDIQTIREFMG